MNNTIFRFEKPQNEAVLSYAPGSPERRSLKRELDHMLSQQIDIPLVIGGKEVRTGDTGTVTRPADHSHVLAIYHKAGEAEVRMAIDAALAAKKLWGELSWVERASILLKAADLLAGKYRHTINAATMLGQGKSCHQAEIDSACETIDFLRFNAFFASRIYAEQPASGFEQLNRMEYRPLEGFVFTVTPFNFTAIASNLNCAVALMGNTTVWKPATTSLLSNWVLMQVFHEAGLPDGVINFVPGRGSLIGGVVMAHPELAGVHFTGSNNTFDNLWQAAAQNLKTYRSYPRLVGETGGKDFIFADPSANPQEVATAIVRGAYEYQGQKCSAASRGYIPRSLWPAIRQQLVDTIATIPVGDETDFSNFMGAVIDKASYDNIMGYVEQTKQSPDAEIVAGGEGDSSQGWFIQPTLIETRDPQFVTMQEELFGPVMTVYVYEDEDFEKTLELCDKTSPYGLTGAVFSRDRYSFIKACKALRYAAGNFYINDKPTGAMVGMQPFGGSRRSGTNDKAGGMLNLVRWTNPRTIKETYSPAVDYRYPFMAQN